MPSSLNSEFDEYARNYFETMHHPLRDLVDKKGDYFIQIKADVINDLIQTHEPSQRGLKVVDVGTGIGLFTKFIGQLALELISIDLSFEMVRVAKILHPISQGGYCQSNAYSLPLPDAYADIVFTSCVLHHIAEEHFSKIFEELDRVCRRGGLVVLFEHNPYNAITQFVVKTTPLDRNARLITSRKIVSYLAEQNLEIVDIKYFLYGPRRLDTLLEQHAKFLHRLPFGGQYYIVARKSSPARQD